MELNIENNQEKIIEKYLERIKQLEIEKKQFEDELFKYKEIHGEITSSLDEFVAMQKLSEIINSTLDENVISKSLLKLISQVVPIKNAAVFLTIEKERRSFPDKVDKILLEIYSGLEEDGILNWLNEKKSSILLPVEDLAITVDRSWESKNLLIIPLVCFNEGIGAVVALSEKPEESYSNKDFELLNMLGFQAATVFHHTKTYRSLHLTHEELKQSQNSLVSTTRLAAVGELSGGVAHEINNPLQIILGNIQLAQLKGDTSESLKVIGEQATRISNIVKGLLNFVRQDYSDIFNEYVVPANILRKTYELIRGQFGKLSINIDFDNLIETAPINLNSNYLQQIFLNLLLNAKSNLLNGGNLIVETKDEDDYILLRIKDDGKPMTKEFIARAKEPFKKQTDGTEPVQLGFAVSLQMIDDIKGLVQINASKGFGNEIIVHLPKNTQNHKEAVDVL